MVWPVFERDEISKVTEILSSGKVNYWTGDEGKSFEGEFASWSQNKYAVAVSNGTVALELILRGLNITQNDEVLVTPRSFIASCSCVVNVGATPVFVDVDPEYGNICPNSIKENITSKTKAIICVHVGGMPCEMDKIAEIAEQNGIFIIEDCAQAHGAIYGTQKVGTFGHASAWSFCQDKIISTGGEGGMVTTNDEELWLKMWSYKDHGKDYYVVNSNRKKSGFQWLHESIGTNWRMTEMQAAIGRLQLKKVDEWVQLRNQNASKILDALKIYKTIKIPIVPQNIQNAYYRCYVMVDPTYLSAGWSKRKIVNALVSAGVPCFDGSCSEIYKEKSFENLGVKPSVKLVNAEYFSEFSFCFLVDHTIKEMDLERWCRAIHKIMRKVSKD